jgi:hypothetical protein
MLLRALRCLEERGFALLDLPLANTPTRRRQPSKIGR